MSTKKEILDYIRHTPGNSNVNVLSSMLDGFAGGGGNVPPPGSDDDGKFLRANSGKWEVVGYPLIDNSITILDTTITVSNQELTPLDISNENFENWVVKINGTQTTWIDEVEVPMWGLANDESITAAVADATTMDLGVVLVAEVSGTYHIEITLNSVEIDQTFVAATKQAMSDYPIQSTTVTESYTITDHSVETDFVINDPTNCDVYVNNQKIPYLSDNAFVLEDEIQYEFYLEQDVWIFDAWTNDWSDIRPGDYTITVITKSGIEPNFLKGVDAWSPIEGGDVILFNDTVWQQAGESVKIYSISTSQTQQEWPPHDPDASLDSYFAIYANDVKLIYDEEIHLWRSQNFEIVVRIESNETVTEFFLDTPEGITPQECLIKIMIPQSVTVKTNFQTGVETVFYTSVKTAQDQSGTQESMNNKYDWGVLK